METAQQILGYVLFFVGVFFMAVAAIGVAKLPDVYCRAHAVGKATTLGILLLLLSLGVLVESVAWWKVAVAMVFQFATIPVASHLFCLVAYRKRVKRWSAKGWTRA
jgi:monovalent cation/proton antiporter, MnhG/PhaG subunit